MIPILPADAWREFRGAAANKGQNHTTHQAVIADANGRLHKCFVKAAPLGNPMVLTESIAWMIAAALDLPRPEFAAVVLLPVGRLRQSMPLDQHWMKYKEVPAFCTSAVPGKHITARWKWLQAARKASAFKHRDIARIAAFDHWVENQDRHTGNFLRTSGGDYIPIDNELILYTLIWLAGGLQYAHNSLRKEARHLLKQAGYTRFEASMAVASLQHEHALVQVAPSLEQFISKVISDSTEAATLTANVLQFLGHRAQRDWLANELGCIV